MNKVFLIGRLGADPKVVNVSDDKTVTNVSIAIDESYKNASGEKVEKTEWVDLIIWGRPGEVLAQYAGKGSLIAVQGKITSQSYEKNGENRKVTRVTVTEYEFLDTKKEASTPAADKPARADDDDLPF